MKTKEMTTPYLGNDTRTKLEVIRALDAKDLVRAFEIRLINHDPLDYDRIETRNLLRDEIERRCRCAKRVEAARVEAHKKDGGAE